MEVALYARVSTPNQHQEGTIASQVQSLHRYIQQQGWSLLPTHEYIDEGVSGARLDRPALDRLRDCAHRGEFDAVVVLSPDRLARNYAHQWLLIEEFEKLLVQWIFLQNPFGDSPQGKLLTQMQGIMAEYERAQILERTRRGRLEKARRGEFIPWAYHCYGYQYLPKRHGCAPQVIIDPEEAEVVRQLYRGLVEEQLSCRQLTKRLNDASLPPPLRKNQVWQPATVRNILTNRVYTGVARYNHRQPTPPPYRNGTPGPESGAKTGRRYRPASEWIESEAPAIITVELFEKAQLQLQRNAAMARKMYQPTSRRYLLRTLVKCGECGLGLNAARRLSACQKYEYLYYDCKGRVPLTCGRVTKCASRRVRADRLDAVVWNALCELLQHPTLLPHLHHTWTLTKQQDVTTLTAQQTQLQQRRQRLERQSQRLLDAYQTELITLSELQLRRQKLTTELHQLDRELQQLAHTQQYTLHWQTVIDHVDHFRHLLGNNLNRLSFTDRQTVAQCLIKKVVVTGEQVDIYYVLPFDHAPQVYTTSNLSPEGTSGNFCRLRLTDLRSDEQPQETVSRPSLSTTAHRPQRDPDLSNSQALQPSHLNDRRRSIKWAQDILASPDRYVILDTETTGLGKTAEVIQIALLDPTGRVLFDTFVRPLKRKSIPSDAARVHGITMKMLKNAPSYPEIADQLVSLIQHRTVIAYNAEYDARLLRQTAERNGGAIPTERWECAMLHYAQFYGEWNDDHGNYRWQKLPGGNHSALGDCQAVLALLQKMAEG